jgi:NADPH-dependent ferric siderophore reductase
MAEQSNPASMTADRAQRPERPRPRFRTVEVRRVSRLGPHMVRVTASGPELEDFEAPAPTQHIKFILPDTDTGRPVLPDPSLPRGASVPGQPRPLMRTYTIRRYDPAAGEIDVDFVLHGDGAGSEWAEDVQPGGFVALAGPGGRPYQPAMDAAWYVIAGDESALPAIGTLLERLPSGMPVQVYAEVPEAGDELAWSSQAQVQTAWLPRNSDGATVGALVCEALLSAPRPQGDGRVWLACEAAVMRRMRKHLLDAWGMDPSQIVTRGYWKLGEPNYKDSDYGED